VDVPVGTEASVLVAGLGDLGGRVLELLAADDRIGTLTGCGRRTEEATALVHQAALVSAASRGAERVGHVEVDLGSEPAVREVLDRARPDVVVFAASRHSWWRTPAAARNLPYGVWLPLQLSLLRVFMRALRASAARSTVVALVHPDAAGPVLAAEGLAPDVGAGNVAEVAAKLEVLVAEEHGCRRADVDVRLVLHHAAERLAFSLFDPGPGPGSSTSDPPYLARVTVAGEVLPDDEVDRLLRQPYPLPQGTGSHQLTAATVGALVGALLDDAPQRLHVPAPSGLPGGYPVVVHRGAVELDLPPGVDRAEAVAVNERAARHDGIAEVGADGRIILTEEASAAAADVLGLHLERVGPDDLDRVADELAEALDRLHRQQGHQQGSR
jgi:hypothetical protein